ncbi:MAG TPA: heavy metal-responsive transcriptional regulator [Thermoanaerobaculia bacterium]|nr:heavy metal-responsive transcriptional regulator [Thermoanaerobaculia bacterium]
MSGSPEYLHSGELAKACGVSPDTLRHYEKRGLLPSPRRLANGYRAYTTETVRRVLVIQRALSVGFTLDELARVLRARDGGRPPCRQVRAMAEAKLRELEGRMRELSTLRRSLKATLSLWDERLASTPDGAPAGLLDSLDGESGPGGGALSAMRFARRAKKS